MQAAGNSVTLDSTRTVDNFMRHQAPDIHPAWDPSNDVLQRSIARYNASPARQQFSQAAQQSTARFRQFVEQFNLNRKSNVQHLTQKFSIQGKNTWAEVQAEAEAAWEAYENKRTRNWFRRRVAGVGDSAPALQSWLDIIPNSNYTSTACGALKILFAACESSNAIRQKVREALDSTADLVEQTSRTLSFNPDAGLNNKAEELYIAMLEATEATLTWLASGTIKEGFKSLFKQDTYSQSIDESFATVRAKAEAFSKLATTLSQEATMRIDQTTLTMKKDLDIIKQNQDSLRQLLLAGALKASWLPQNVVFNLTVQPANQIQSMSAEQLLKALNTDPGICSHDLTEILNVEDVQLHRVTGVVGSPQFQNWFTSADSAVLVVDDLAREEPGLDFTHTTLTSLSAKLIANITELGLGLPLFFFCDQHVQSCDPLSGALGMMKALNCQMIRQFQGYDVPFVDYDLFHRIHSSDFLSQWELFEKTMENTRPMVIFCIIDGLSAFDNGLHGEDIGALAPRFQQLIQSLNGAGQEYRVGPTLKVLVTMPQMTSTSARWFEQAEVLTVPEWGYDTIDGLADMILSK